MSTDAAGYFHLAHKCFLIFRQPFRDAVTSIRKEVITSFWMGVTAHWMGQQIPEVLPGEEKMFLVKIKSTQQYQ